MLPLARSLTAARCFSSVLRRYATRSAGFDEKELSAARAWMETLNANTIPKAPAEISYARSQGAGGQHVNKTESKATLRYPLDELYKIVPKLLHAPLKASRYYVASSNSLRITIEEHRQQKRNLEGCWERLLGTLREVGQTTIPGETSQEQIDKVTRMKKAENESRLRLKKKLSDKKRSRSGREDY